MNSQNNRKPVVVGNWKMNGSFALIDDLLSGIINKCALLDEVDVVVCPSYPYLSYSHSSLENSNIKMGAQNVSQFASGAYTGEVSTDMLKEFGCEYVILGHSERRKLLKEDNEIIRQKVKAVIDSDMKAILCVGETQQEYDSGETESVISKQINSVVSSLSESQLSSLLIAYEPVWAIGTGKTATPDIAQNVHKMIRNLIKEKFLTISNEIVILYGGSLKASNAKEMFAQMDIDGGLIGGASLDAKDFFLICKSF